MKIRIPRPAGVTQRSQQIRKEKDSTKKERKIRKLREYILRLYVTDDMKLNDERISVEKISRYLKCNQIEVMRVLQEEIARISNFMGNKDNEAYARVSNFRALFLGLKVQGLAVGQAEVLAKAQGNKYVPFLSGALNQAIGNLNGTWKTQIELSRMLNDYTKIMPGINDDKDFGNTGTRYITPDEAMRILESQPTLITDEAYLIDKKKAIGALPDVCARNQDLSTIGINLNKNIIIPQVAPIPPDVASFDKKEGTLNRHGERPFGIDDEAHLDDFKA